jgi:hypothetical protein
VRLAAEPPRFEDRAGIAPRLRGDRGRAAGHEGRPVHERHREPERGADATARDPRLPADAAEARADPNEGVAVEDVVARVAVRVLANAAAAVARQ